MASPNDSAIPVHFQNAVIDAFFIQIGLRAEVAAVVTENVQLEKSASEIDCMSVLGLQSSAFRGSLALGFPRETFLRILERMIGEKHESITPLNADACSELLNIIYASGRVRVNEAGFDFFPAIPTTVCGKNISLAFGSANKFLKLSFRTDLGDFILALSLARLKR